MNEAPSELANYVDGAGGKCSDLLAWAICVLADSHGDLRYLGLHTRTVCFYPTSHEYIGAQSASSGFAE
eukprot:9296818-Heterocapsa_arctica.AAC.1